MRQGRGSGSGDRRVVSVPMRRRDGPHRVEAAYRILLGAPAPRAASGAGGGVVERERKEEGDAHRLVRAGID